MDREERSDYMKAHPELASEIGLPDSFVIVKKSDWLKFIAKKNEVDQELSEARVVRSRLNDLSDKVIKLITLRWNHYLCSSAAQPEEKKVLSRALKEMEDEIKETISGYRKEGEDGHH